MPKKSSTMRDGAQRQRPRAQKSIALVRPDSAKEELTDERIDEFEGTGEEVYAPVPSLAMASSAPVEELRLAEQNSSAVPAAKGNASARLAARRQATQRVQVQRGGGSLVTTEHFAYVRKDLIFIALLAVIMIVIIVVAYFLFGRGA